MRTKILLPMLGALVAGTLFACGGPTQSSLAVGGTYGPEPYYDDVEYGRAGHVWVNGYWNWDGYRWNWVEGYYITDRPGYVYSQPGWYVSGGHRYYRAGRWATGRDHDRYRTHRRVDRPGRYDRVRPYDTARRPYYQRSVQPGYRRPVHQQQRPVIRDHRDRRRRY